MQKNGLAEPVLDFVDVARTPHIVDAARMGHHPQMSAADEEQLRTLLSDVSAVTPQFSLLITAYCHNNPILYKCFGGIADYTELLLPNDILAENGFVDTLNHTEFITDTDFASPELIGWLYQFYISERKDEVFAKKGKFEADEIPAATQIFTPNWIVKYMVQNTVGRIYLDNNPWATDLKDKWKYLVEPSEPTTEEAKLKYKDLTDLRVGDLACGSGHILNECFDLLFDLYIEDGYSRSEAIEAIFKYNLTGIDLDTRAKQLATFALLLKACQRDSSFADAHVMPNILNMPEPQKDEEALTTTLHHFFKGGESRQDITSLLDAFKLMRDADSLGSIMIFDIPDSTRALIKQTVEYYDAHADQQEYFTEILPAMKLILALTEKYHALVMNPPYMGDGNMNKILSDYTKNKYPAGRADLATSFIERLPQLLLKKGLFSFIVPPSWMFLSTYEKLRNYILDNNVIESLLHLSRGVFGADFGSSCPVIRKYANPHYRGVYFKLVNKTFQEFKQSHLRLLFEKSNLNHGFRFDFNAYNKDLDNLECASEGKKIYYSNIDQSIFQFIPNRRLGYWLNDSLIELFKNQPSLKDINPPRSGLSTGDNDRFLKFWHEVNFAKIYFDGRSREDLKTFTKKWVPMTKGGEFRRWYGNNEYIINFENDAEELKDWLVNNPNDPRTKSYSRRMSNYERYCESGFSFSDVCIGHANFRYQKNGFIPNSRGPFIYSNDFIILGFLNSSLPEEFLSVLAPTMTFNVGDIALLPYVEIENNQAIEMCQIHRSILDTLTDTTASVISNNLNNVMKILTIVTIVISIPTLIGSFWGMNVSLPFENNKYGFWILIALSTILTIIGGWLLYKVTGVKKAKKK